MEDDEYSEKLCTDEFNEESESGSSTDEEGDGDDDDDDDENLLEESDSDVDGDRCPICLNRFREQDIGTPESCDHDFCLECIQEWSKNVNTCPVDRQIFKLIFCKHQGENRIFKKIPIEDKVAVDDDDEEDDEEPTYCEVCHQCDREDRLLLCDGCDLGYHLECLTPPLREVPVDEWFCPECHRPEDSNAEMEEEANLAHRPRRQIPRTIVMERVRSAIEEIRVRRTQDLRGIISDSENEDILEPPQDSSPATTVKTAVKSVKRKIKPKTKSRGKRKSTKGRKRKYRKRKAGRRIRRKYRKRSIKARTVKLQPLMTPKTRIAGALGLTSLPKGRTIPLQKLKTDKSLDTGVSSLCIFGDKEELIHFDDDYGVPNEATRSNNAGTGGSRYSKMALSSYRPIGRVPAKLSVVTDISKIKLPAGNGPVDLLGSIMQDQKKLHLSSKDITIQRDGSLTSKDKLVSMNIESSANYKVNKKVFGIDNANTYTKQNILVYTAHKSSQVPNKDGEMDAYDPAHPTDDLELENKPKCDLKSKTLDNEYDPAHPTDELSSGDEIQDNGAVVMKADPDKQLENSSCKNLSSSKDRNAILNSNVTDNNSKVGVNYKEIDNASINSVNKSNSLTPSISKTTHQPSVNAHSSSQLCHLGEVNNVSKGSSFNLSHNSSSFSKSLQGIKPFEISRRARFERRGLYGGEIDFTEDVDFSEGAFPDSFEVKTKKIQAVFKDTKLKPDNFAETKADDTIKEHLVETIPLKDSNLVKTPPKVFSSTDDNLSKEHIETMISKESNLTKEPLKETVSSKDISLLKEEQSEETLTSKHKCLIKEHTNDKASLKDKNLVKKLSKETEPLNETFCVKDPSKEATSSKNSNAKEMLVKAKVKLENIKEFRTSSVKSKPLSLKCIENKNAADNGFKHLKDSDPDIGILDEEDPIHEMRKHEKELDVEFGKTDFGKKNNEKEAKKSKRKVSIDTKISDKGMIKHKDEVKQNNFDSVYLFQKDAHRKDDKKYRKKSEKKKIKAEKDKIEEGEYIEDDDEIDTRIVIQVSQNTGNRTVWQEADKYGFSEKHRSGKRKTKDNDSGSRKAKKRKRHKFIEKRSRSLSIEHARSRSKEETRKKRKDYKDRSKSRSRNRSAGRTHKKRRKMKRKSQSRSRDQSRNGSRERIRDWSREKNRDQQREVSRDRNYEHDFGVEDRSPGKRRNKKRSRDRSSDSGKDQKWRRDKSGDRVDIFGRSRSPLIKKKLLKGGEPVLPFIKYEQESENENKYSDIELPATKDLHYDDISSSESDKTLIDKEIEIEEGEIVSNITVKVPTVREKVISVEIGGDDEFDEEEPEETEQFQYTDRDEYLSQSKSKQQRQNLIEIGFSENHSDVLKSTEPVVKSTQPSSPVRPPLPETVTVNAPPLPPIPDFLKCPPLPGPPLPGHPPGPLSGPPPCIHQHSPHQPGPHHLGPHQLAPHQQGPTQPELDPRRILIQEHPPSFPVQVNLPQGHQGIFTDMPLPGTAPALEPGQPVDIQHRPSFSMDLNMLPPPGFHRGLPPTIAPQRPLILSPMNAGPPRLPGLVSPRFSWQVSTSEVVNNHFGATVSNRLATPAANQHMFEGLQPHAEDLPNVSLQHGNLQISVNSHNTSRHITSIQTNNSLHDVLTTVEKLPIHFPPLRQESKHVHIGPDPRAPPLRLPIPLLPTTTDVSSMSFISSISNNASLIAASHLSVCGTDQLPVTVSRLSVCGTDHLTTTTNILNSVTSILGLNKIDTDTVKIPVQNVPLLQTYNVIAPDMPATEIQKADRRLNGLERIIHFKTQPELINSTTEKDKQTKSSEILNKLGSPKLKDDQIFKVPLPPGGKFMGTNSESEGSEVVDMEIGSPIDDEVSIELPVSPQFDNLIDNPADLLEEDFNKKMKKTYKDSDFNSSKTSEDELEESNSKDLTEVKDVIKSNDKKQKRKENKHHHHRENKPKVKKQKLTTKKEHKRKALKDAQVDIDTQEIPISAVDMVYKEKYLKKLHLQERVIEEVKMAIKPHYANKEVTKDQYKDILRRAVPKICHSKSGNINPMKIKSLVQAYVEKFNKKSTKESDLKEQSSSAVKS